MRRTGVFVLVMLGLSVSWAWADAPVCPPGTLPVGGVPPAAYEQKCVLPDGKAHGPWRTWYPNGQLMTETPMDHGREHGEIRAWWPNGQLMMRGQSIYGNRYKQAEYWDAQGQRREMETQKIETVVPADASPQSVIAPKDDGKPAAAPALLQPAKTAAAPAVPKPAAAAGAKP